jgi:hypothetical protein
MAFVTLTTARQTLRPMLPGDAEAMFAMHADPEVMRYVPDSGFASVDEARAFLVGYEDVYRIEGFARWAAIETATSTWLGWCGLRRQSDGQVDVGYRYAKGASSLAPSLRTWRRSACSRRSASGSSVARSISATKWSSGPPRGTAGHHARRANACDS